MLSNIITFTQPVQCVLLFLVLAGNSAVSIFTYTRSYSSHPFLCALVTKYETEVIGLTPNGSEVNHICESLNYQCLSHWLGNEANNIVHDELIKAPECILCAIKSCSKQFMK